MTRRALIILVTVILAAAGGRVTAEGAAAAPASRPSRGATDDYRYLDHGAWIVTEARVKSNGVPAAIRRKVTVVTVPGTGQRALQEARWTGDGFEVEGEPRLLPTPDRRTFDQLGLKPHATLPDQVVEVAKKRYACSVTQYLIAGDDGRSTLLTLWRDRSGGTRLPPRTIALPNRELPLPPDALRADYKTDGPRTSMRGERRVVSLAAPLRVNNHACACLVESTEARGTTNGKPVEMSLTEWFCHELPGEKLRTVTAASIGETKLESDVAVTEFHVPERNASHVR